MIETETLACLDCLITFDYECEYGVCRDAKCPECGGAYGNRMFRTGSMAFMYSVLREEEARGELEWRQIESTA